MAHSTEIQPASYSLDNFGSDVQALTFTHGGKVHTLNRHGKRNILGFLSNVSKTYTLTNGVERFARMSLFDVKIESITYTDGRTELHLR